MDNIKEHKHCKICQRVIEVDNRWDYVFRPYVELGVCQKCVIVEGIKSLKRKNIK